MTDGPRRVDSEPPCRPADWILLLANLPGEAAAKPAGVLLLVVPHDKLLVALADGIGGDEDTLEVWASLKEDLEGRASEMGGAAFLDYVENDLSNFLQVGGPRQRISIADEQDALAQLFERHVLQRIHSAQGT